MYDALLAETVLKDMWNDKSSGTIVSTMEKYMNDIDKFIEDIAKAAEEHNG